MGTWNTSDFATISNLSVLDSATLDNEDLDFSGGSCSISNSTGTNAVIITGASAAALQAKVEQYNNTALLNSAVGIRIEYTGVAAPISIIMSGTTFSGDTVDVHYNSTNASELTITPSGGTSIATTAISGNATGVTVDSAVAITLSAPNPIDGTRFQIYNVTQTTELYNAVVSGGSGISIATTIGTGLAIEIGDELRLRTGFQSTTTYKEPTEDTIIANSSSNVWTRTQAAWTVVESYGLDGSTYDGAPFTADHAADEVDIAVASNFSGASFGAWWGYILTTSNGISDFFGGVTFIDAANIQINSSILALLLDNQTTTEVFQTDTIRIFRADGTRPVKNPSTGGGGIDLNWKNVVYLQTTGSGALTTEQSSQLASASTKPSASDIVDEWETQSQADPTGFQVNIKEVNDVVITGVGAGTDTFGPA